MESPFVNAGLPVDDVAGLLAQEASHPCTVVHMSDNGETWWYMGRTGWTELASGEILGIRNAHGYEVQVFEHPQHYTVWRYDGASGTGEFPFSFSFE